ncbi:MAG: hypothetical protein ISN28_08245 [Ectothiorhodospiraceae bacterium AqS1]|nr:hypothetical protein [Ectothiorhodospiraceae bacterium AqS1]
MTSKFYEARYSRLIDAIKTGVIDITEVDIQRIVNSVIDREIDRVRKKYPDDAYNNPTIAQAGVSAALSIRAAIHAAIPEEKSNLIDTMASLHRDQVDKEIADAEEQSEIH